MIEDSPKQNRRQNDIQIALILEKLDKVEKHQDEMIPSVAVLQTTLHEHLQKYDLHRLEETARWNHILTTQEQNTESIKDLITSTQDLLGAWRAANGAVKIGAAISKFIKWIGSFAVLGIVGAWIMDVFE
jgi:hypothetical protein